MEQSQALALVDMFSYQGNSLRHLIINDEPWWVAGDVCKILEHSDVSMAVSRLDEDEKLIQALFVSGQHRNTFFVNESGVYHLIFTSRKPEAQTFRKWVTNEVLPAIRKTGSYSLQGMQDFNIGEMLMLESQDEFNQRIKRIRVVRRAIGPQQPKLPKALSEPKQPKPVPTVREAIVAILADPYKYQGQKANSYDISQAGGTLLRTLGSVATRRACEELVAEGILDKEGQGKTTLYSLKQV